MSELQKENEVIQIDLSKDMNEGVLAQFGAQVEHAMKMMFADTPLGAEIRGTAQQIKSFLRTLGNEKRYLDIFNSAGLGNGETYKSKYRLDQSVREFETSTGVKWPFK